MSPFEAIRHTDDDGQEFWSARELMVTLGYTTTFLVGAMGICFVGQHCWSDFSPLRMPSAGRRWRQCCILSHRISARRHSPEVNPGEYRERC